MRRSDKSIKKVIFLEIEPTKKVYKMINKKKKKCKN
jgi:hypothetical protein